MPHTGVIAICPYSTLLPSIRETRVNDSARVAVKANSICFELFAQNNSTQDLTLVTRDSIAISPCGV